MSDEQKRAEYDSFGGATSSGFNSGFQQQQNPFSQQGRQGNFRWEYKVKPLISLERGGGGIGWVAGWYIFMF